VFWGALQHGTCTVIPTRIDFDSSELLNMIHHAGLNRINAFPTFLCTHLRNARHNPKLLAALKGLDDILYSGLELPQEDDSWCRANGLKFTNIYGSTELGAMMLSNHGPLPEGRFLRPIEGTKYGFFPISSEQDTESGVVDVHSRLLECVILSSSPDCPDKSLRAADGHYHTGDLFAEVAPGAYVFRGRNDDWIKSENSLRVDTKAIEDNVRTTCMDLIAECIVVGSGRPCPALFVESAVNIDHAKLKKEILRRIKPFHTRRYLHERITSTNCIVVVPANTLPRTATKGNIRRKAVEEQFRTVLDAMHGRPTI
jgi:acyl-coenzyme A synthetase/AMP-(fatty) acid ligase